MVIRSFKGQKQENSLDYFAKIVETEEIGKGYEIILSKTGRGNETEKVCNNCGG